VNVRSTNKVQGILWCLPAFCVIQIGTGEYFNTSHDGWQVDIAIVATKQAVLNQPGKTTRLTARSRETLWRSVLISPFRRLEDFVCEK
jgi:hypothetical protein